MRTDYATWHRERIQLLEMVDQMCLDEAQFMLRQIIWTDDPDDVASTLRATVQQLKEHPRRDHDHATGMQIIKGRDGGGWRDFLDDRAIHAGDIIHMRIQGMWVPGRYEMDYHSGSAFFYTARSGDHHEEVLVILRDQMRFCWP